MSPLDKRIERWVCEWAKARARWAIRVRQDNYFETGRASENHLTALHHMTYCEDKFMQTLFDARNNGHITQEQVETHIQSHYPRMVEQSDQLIKDFYDGKFNRPE